MINKRILKQGERKKNPAFFSCFTRRDTLLFFSIGREISLPIVFLLKNPNIIYPTYLFKPACTAKTLSSLAASSNASFISLSPETAKESSRPSISII